MDETFGCKQCICENVLLVMLDGLRFSVVVSSAAGMCASNLTHSSPKRLLTAYVQELYASESQEILA